MTKPQTIGNFQLLRTLGEGGMGVVFEAEHVTMHRRAAIKVLRSELIKDEQAIRRFFNEARATNEVRHPGIVQIYDCGTREDGSPWLIMELLEGETLSRRMARLGPMPTAEVITLGTQTASVLEAAHRAGIIHRDLKPDNLFIVNNQETPTGERIKVLDFGIAKLTSSGGAKSMHTQTGMLMGTPLYMSPEQCRGVGHVDARSDIYSFGLILYQMVSGDLPFVSEGMGELFDMQMNHPPPPLERKVPGIAPALADMIYRTLKKDPSERFQTMAELQRALVAAGEAPRPAAPPAPAVMTAAASSPPAAATTGSGASRTLPISSTTLSAGAMEMEPFEVPRHRMAQPLLIAAAALLLVGGGIIAMRSFGSASASSENGPEEPVAAA
ncbi:MAG TPA: serine/threonine-protein kinase, partial [Polyangia bacterium]|nr:serine/threonine-protein kinase [Polyangia bacterium]